MMDNPRLDILGAALGESSRSRILCELMEGRAFTNKELACAAEISPQTATAHLRQLEQAGLTVSLRSGRRVYHRLAGPDVAETLERLACLTPSDHLRRHRKGVGRQGDTLLARRCYNHIAGRLGVLITERLSAMDVFRLQGDALIRGARHAAFCTELGLCSDRGRSDRLCAKLCLDWTERRHHLSGPFATAFLDLGLQAGWFDHRTGSRALGVTATGYGAVEKWFGLSAEEINSGT